MIDETQAQIRKAVASWGAGSAGPTALVFQGMLLRMKSHELTRDYATTYCDPDTGFNLATALTFQPFSDNSWRAGGSKLRGLAEAGVDVNHPDAQGRVASLQGFFSFAPLIDGNDLDWAVRHGMDPLCVEHTSMGLRSLLTLAFGDEDGTGRMPEFWRMVQVKVNTALRNLERENPAAAVVAFGRLAQAPVHPAHRQWMAKHKLRLLDNALSVPVSSQAKPRL